MENENLEIEEYKIEEQDVNEIDFFTAEELISEESHTTSSDLLLKITYKFGKKSNYWVAKKFAILLKNKITLVAGPISGLFILKVTQPNGTCFFQVVDAFGFVKQDNLSTLEEALQCIYRMVDKEAKTVCYSGPTLGR